MIAIFARAKIVADSTKASESSAIISRSPALALGVARVLSKFGRANGGTGSERQCDVHMPPRR
jgi:hypothetical protein